MTTTHPATMFDRDAREIVLGPRLGRGGEGTTYEVSGADRQRVVVKAWKPDLARDPAMVAAVAQTLESGWPDPTGHRRVVPIRNFAYDEEGDVVGVMLDRLPAALQRLADLLTTADRRRAQLSASDRWKLRVAARVADIVDRAHDRGLVIADLGPANFCVDIATARVTVFDADAWQTNRETVRPRRIAEDARAPEHWAAGSTAIPTRASDRWSLAVAIVQILLDWDHPCNGVRPGQAVDDAVTVADNVRDGYSHLSDLRLRSVAGAPRLEQFTPRVRELVTHAFGTGHLSPLERPTAREWVLALRADDAELGVR